MFIIYHNLINSLLSIILTILLVILIDHIYKYYKFRKQLPPGPIGLPIVGYLPFLGKEPHKDIAKLGAIYGNVFTLQLGVHNVVILNDWEAVKEAFHRDEFLGRPDNYPFIFIRKSSFGDDNGQLWREHRRFAINVFKELGFGEGRMEDRIIEEIGYLIAQIDESNGRPFNIHSLLTPSMSNIISQLVFGHRFEFNDTKRCLLDQSLDKLSQRFSMIGLLAVSPKWFSKLIVKLGYFGKDTAFDESTQTLFTFSKIFQNEISNHKKVFNVNNKRDYIDAYIEEMVNRKKTDPNTTFTVDKLDANLKALFGAGSETSRTACEWSLIFVTHYREYQKKIHEEIDSIVGRDRSPVWADRQHMPFTQAFINEVLRYKTILSLNLLRSSLVDTTLLGHSIPKNTHILANMWAVHNDPKIWHNPDQFNPYRFLTEDGQQVVKIEALIPFSTGKRSCAGENVARLQVFLYFISLLQRYTIRAPEDSDLSFDDRFGLSLQPKQTLILRFEKRV